MTLFVNCYLYLPSWEWVFIHLFRARLNRVRFVDVQLFDHICPSIGKLLWLTVWVVGVVSHPENCQPIAVQEVLKIIRHIHQVLRRIQVVILCYGQKCVFAHCVFSCGLWFWSDVVFQSTMSTSSSVRLTPALRLQNVCKAFFRRCEWNWYSSIASVISDCIFCRAWWSSSNCSNFLFFLSKINMFVVVGLFSADNVGCRCWDAWPAFASASLLIGLPVSEFCLCSVSSTIGAVLLGELCSAKLCGWL